jgi:NADP-reducing hydrogenase subunit HndD
MVSPVSPLLQRGQAIRRNSVTQGERLLLTFLFNFFLPWEDNPFGESTGAAVIFGATGGVMEAALRTAADVISGKTVENVTYEAVRGMHGIKAATIKLGLNNEIDLNVAVCHQMRNVREFLAKIEQGNENYHFIEIMTCPGTLRGRVPTRSPEDASLNELP